jgi:hypothetical protein
MHVLVKTYISHRPARFTGYTHTRKGDTTVRLKGLVRLEDPDGFHTAGEAQPTTMELYVCAMLAILEPISFI